MTRSAPTAATRLATRARVLAMLLLPACTLIIDPEVGAGLGTPCAYDEQCQGAICIEGICAVRCGDSNGCPGGTECADNACQLPLFAGFVYASDVDQFDFVRAFDDSRMETEDVAELAYVHTTAVSPYPLASDAADEARKLIALGHQIVVGTTRSHAEAFAAVAGEHTETTVLAFQSPLNQGNLISFDARMYQAYYLAGVVAGRTTITNRVGFVASTSSPPTIASVNAFALGVQQAAPTALVEIRFLGEPHDTKPKVSGKSRERVFVEEMVQTNSCDVIAHNVDNNIPTFTVRDLRLEDPALEIWAIGQNVADACVAFSMLPASATEADKAAVAGRCRATTFYQWAPMFARVFDDVHRDREIQSPILEKIGPSNSGSVVGFSTDPSIVGQATASLIDDLRADLAGDEGVGRIFTGPIESTGGCTTSPCIEAGVTLDDAGLASMCWLVLGVVGADSAPLLVPAEGDCLVE